MPRAAYYPAHVVDPMTRKWKRPPWWAVVVGLGVSLFFGRFLRPCIERTVKQATSTMESRDDMQYDDIVVDDASRPPNGWPSFCPMYPDAKIRAAARITNWNGMLVETEAPATADDVFAFYKLRLEAEGFTMEPGLLRNKATFRSGKRTVIIDAFSREPGSAKVMLWAGVDK